MVRKRVVSTGSLFVAIVSMVFIVFFNHQTAASANIVSSAIYALEDTTIVYEGIDSGKIMYEDEGLGYLNIGYQGGYGSPIEVQSKLTKLLNHTIPEIHPKPTLVPFDFTSHISEENLKTNPTATFILSVLSAEEARSADIPTKEHYIQTTDITYTEIEDIEITGVVNDGIYNTNVTPQFNIGTATLNGASFSSGTTITVEGSYTLVVTDGSLSKTLQFEIDKTPPTATVLINNGSYFTNHQFVDVTITPDPGVDDIVRMRYSVNSSQVSTTQLYYSQFSIGVGSDNGDKSVRVELIDAAGNISPLYFWNFSMNTTIPTGTLTINSGAAYTTEREVDLLITPDVGANEIVSMQFSADNNNWSSVEGYSPSKRYTLPTGDGDKTVFVRLIDRFGNIGVIQRSILLNTKPPTASVLINNGNVYTNNANVVVAITPDVGVNDIAFIRYMINSSTPTTIPYIDSFVINVGNTNEEKEITVTLISGGGNISPIYSSTIILDTLEPTGTVAINGGAAYAASTGVTLTFTLGADVADVEGVQFSNDNLTWSTKQVYSPSMSYILSAGEGNKTVYVRFIDRAGNIGTAQDSITLDTIAPTGTLNITSPMITNATSITLEVTSSDADYMELGETGQPYEAQVAYNGSIQKYTLQDAEEDGVKTIQVRLSDQAGNTTVLTADVTLDQTVPSGTVVVNDGELYTNDADVTVEVTPATGVTDIVDIRYTVNGTPKTIAYTDSFVIDVGSTNEEKEITVELIDKAGNGSPAYTSKITLDTVAPTGTVSINGGAASATSQGVTLKFTLGAGVTDVVGVQFSDDNVTWSTEEAYSPSMSYNLSAGEGSKTVYVRFIDRAGNVSEATSASIIYRTIPEPSHSTGHTSEVASTENPVSADVMIKFGEDELEGAFTGQVHVQGSSIEILLSKAQLTHLSKTHENQTIEVSLMGTYSKSQLIVSNEALDKLAANSNSLLFKTTGQQFLLSSQELKQMLATNHSSYVISIKHESEGMFAQAKEQAQKGAYQLIGVPITIDLMAQNEDNSLHLQELGTIVLRSTGTGELPSAVLKLLDNGVQSPVTAAISVNNQSYYAKVTSYGSGTYMLIRKQPRFTDVSGWSLKAIDTLSSKLILSGVNETTFEPKRAITRAEFATIISKALGLVETSGSLNYTDVVTGAWYSDAVATVAELGFMNGYPDTTYRPTQKITREEAMVIVARVLHHLDSKKVLSDSEIDRVLGEYSDQAQISIWSRNDIASSVQEGIIMGINGKLAVKDQITREQVAAMIVRLLEHAEIL